MVTYREFLRENERLLVIVGKELIDSSIEEIEKILEKFRGIDKVYVITNSISPRVASYLRKSKIIVIDNLYFEKEEDAFQKFAREYALKEINNKSN
jgi:GTP:adenosylcobinamide-phosphate guanylyltransferase